MENPLLQINDLCVDFIVNGHTTQALQHINISVARGEVLAIVGESGSGKSVTSLSVLQLLPAPPAVYRSGDIRFSLNGQTRDILKLSQAELQSLRGRHIAMIFQEPMTSLNPLLTCGFQVMEAILEHAATTTDAARAKTITLFEQVQLPDPELIFKRYPHQLSGGQKQRVMIAMAMSCEPALLICDEPTTALDVTVQKNILQLIRQLQQQNNMGVIFITHDLGIVSEIADRVAVMYKGKLVEENSTQQLFKNPQHPYTRALLACRPALYAKGERLPVVSDFLDPEGKERSEVSKTVKIQSHPQSALETAQQVLLKAENLSVHYPGKRNLFGRVLNYTKAVDGVSFEVFKGETLGLVGESGCGKSTLGRALIRLIDATGGNLVYKGEHLLRADPGRIKELRKDMQIIFQDPYSSLNPRITIGEAIAEPLKVHDIAKDAKERKEKVIDLLEKVSLSPEHYKRYPHEFSGGQRQRIVIARALALNPSFIICDESVSALDVSVQAQVLNLLNDLKKTFGFTAFFISHDLSGLRFISDRIILNIKERF